jgi:hypothetical protein
VKKFADAITDFGGAMLADSVVLECTDNSRGKTPVKFVSFTWAPCYPYELASKNKSPGEIDGC